MTGSGRVFLLGATGWLGSAIAQRLDQVVAVPAREFVAGGWADLQRRLAEGDVLVNAAGSKDPATMQQVNTELVAQLVEVAEDRGVALVQVGSAAEYGIPDSPRPLRESDPAHPTSEYGRSKLAATDLVLGVPRGCSLRVFNIAANPPQPGSPLEDVRGRVAAGIAAGRGPEVLSAGTRRDWVTRDFVADSVAAAVRLQPSGVFNVCSGSAVGMGELARALLVRRGSDLPVIDLRQAPASTVVGDPSAWCGVSGLDQQLTADDIAALLDPEAGSTR